MAGEFEEAEEGFEIISSENKQTETQPTTLEHLSCTSSNCLVPALDSIQ